MQPQQVEGEPTGHGDGEAHSGWRRAVLVLAACAVLALVLSSDAAHEALQRLIVAAEPLVVERPVIGMLVFTGLSAVSASLAFFSSSLLVPAAVHGWGVPVTIALLWSGWLLGGVVAFGIGRALRRPLTRSRAMPAWIRDSLEDLRPGQRFLSVLVVQLTLPSELPAYLCGALGVPLRTYVLALAIAELPYAAITVLIGASVVDRERGLLLLLGVVAAVGVLAISLLIRMHRRRQLGASTHGSDDRERSDVP